MTDIRYLLNVKIPLRVNEELNEVLGFLQKGWVFYILVALIFFFAFLYMFRRYFEEKKKFINFDSILEKLADTKDINVEEQIIMNELKIAKNIAFYQSRGNVYILIDSKTEKIEFPFRIPKEDLDEYKNIGDNKVGYIKNSDEKYLLLFADKKLDIEDYKGHLKLILNYYEKTFEKNIKDAVSLVSDNAAKSFMKINMNQEEFLRFFTSLLKKIVKSEKVYLLKNSENIEIQGNFKKDFYIRNTPYKVTVVKEENLSPQEIKKIGSFIDLAGHYLVNFASNKKIIDNYIELLKLAVEAMEINNPFYKNHSEIVEIVSVETAKALYLSQKEIDNIALASKLHDIGMIGDMVNFLDKTELSKEELNLLKQHPIIGSSIVEPINQTYEIADIIKYHHERYDGRGYPFGLKGVNIPISANIVALGEFYAGITSDRAYKKGISHDEAVKEIKDLSNKYFEKSIVDAFLNVEKRINTKILKVKK
ncbi:HD-GYP domain-containing protein [Caminibacter pacificus]